MAMNDAATQAILARLSEGDAVDGVALKAITILADARKGAVRPRAAAPRDPVRFLAEATQACIDDRGAAMVSAVGRFVVEAAKQQPDKSATTLLVLNRDAYEAVRVAALAAVNISQGVMPAAAEPPGGGS
jgi:hypothetical protein